MAILISSFFLIISFFLPSDVIYAERIKDIASIKGARENQLIGYGLVVGLNGTGDKGRTTLQTIADMLFRLGLTVNQRDLKSKNAAAVIITATLPPFPKIGNKIDVIVSTLGDARDLRGGTLLLSPLKGPDRKTYALAQGPVSIGGFSERGAGVKAQKNHPTVGKVPNGATIEREIAFSLETTDNISIILHRPDFTTASNVKRAINNFLHEDHATSPDSSTVNVVVPSYYKNSIVDFIQTLESLNVTVDVPAKVVINERTGTIVIGNNVKISPVAIAHGGLTVEIKTDFWVSQPPPFAPESSETVVVPDANLTVEEQEGYLVELSGINLGEIVTALNSLGVTPIDLVAILQALKAAGALRADLEII